MLGARKRWMMAIVLGGALQFAGAAAAQPRSIVSGGHGHHGAGRYRRHPYHSSWRPYFHLSGYPRYDGYDWYHLPSYRSFSYYTGPFGGAIYYQPTIIYPPIAGDAGALFGPRAIWNQLGVTQPPVVANIRPRLAPQQEMILVRPGGGAAGQPGRDLAAEARVRARAKQLIGVGDGHFRNGNDRLALRRYRDAIAAAPTFAQGWFRRGFAEVSVGRYAEAVAAMERGLRLDPNWSSEPFHLRAIYAGAEAITANHEALAKAALANPNDGGLLFLIGVYMHFDSQPERARSFFRKALVLGDHAEAVQAFLPQDHKPELAEPIPPPNGVPQRGREF